MYVAVGYRTEEETCLAGDYMARVGAEMVEETDILVALAPFVVEPPQHNRGNAVG
jgi:hypothetical protein